MISKVKLIKRNNIHPESPIESNESFEQRINDFLLIHRSHRCNPPMFLSVDLCCIYYEEDSDV